MSVLVQAQIHGLVGRDAELTEVLREHAAAMGRAEGCVVSRVASPLMPSTVATSV